MKVLVLTHYWRPHIGGIETVAREQALGLVVRGHTVTVVTSKIPRDAASFDDDGIVVRRVAAANPLEPRAIPYPLYSPAGLVSTLRREIDRHDVILAHGHTYLGTVFAAALARRRRRPLVILQHNPHLEYSFPWNRIQHIADLLLGRYTFSRATTIAAVSEFTAAYVRRLAPGRPIEIVRSGVDLKRFSPAASPDEKRALRRGFGIPEGAFVVVTVRRLTYRHGVDVLIDAARRLPADVFVAICGDGPEREEIERTLSARAQHNVVLLGRVPDERLADLYRCADAFALPTRSGEGFGLVLLEAAASGLPVVSTRGGGQEEVVHEGTTGLLARPGSIEDLQRGIAALATNAERCAEMSAAARRAALEQSWETTVVRLEAILADAIAKAR